MKIHPINLLIGVLLIVIGSIWAKDSKEIVAIALISMGQILIWRKSNEMDQRKR